MAPVGRRIAARLIDCWLIGVTLVAVWGLGFHLATADCNGVSRCYGFTGFGITLVVVVFGAIATVLYDSVGLAYWGQTIGKAALGLRVTQLGGSRPQWSKCLVRAIAFWLSVPVSGVAIYVIYNLLNIGSNHDTWKYLAVVLSPLCITGITILMIVRQRRPFHDLVAGTHVVYEVEHGVPSVSRKRGWSTGGKIAGASLSAATAVGVGVLVWALIAASGQGLSASEKQSYIGDNERLLDSLPQIPGSLRLNMQLLPYCTNGVTIGYVTHASYRTLAQMSNQDVVDFYVRNLGDAWQHTVTNTPVEVPYSTNPRGPPGSATVHIATWARFQRGSAHVDINIDDINLPPGSYAVSVDSHRAGSVSCHED